ncbi:hypothetical protein K8I28_07080 [bacterium]|nr:hypothetical protein [bacterium]
MDWDIKRIQSHVVRAPTVTPTTPRKTKESDDQFSKTLEKATQRPSTPNVTISAHASQRLLQRGIHLDQHDLNKIDAGMDRATAKGARDSLFLMRDLAFLVSVENRTVITAMDGESAKDNVFTKIDSALIL